MSGKRPSLAENMKALAEAPAPVPSAPPPAAIPATSTQKQTREAADHTKSLYAATRAGKKKATATLSAEAHRQLKLRPRDPGGIKAVLTEAINDLFRKHGMKPIA